MILWKQSDSLWSGGTPHRREQLKPNSCWACRRTRCTVLLCILCELLPEDDTINGNTYCEILRTFLNAIQRNDMACWIGILFSFMTIPVPTIRFKFNNSVRPLGGNNFPDPHTAQNYRLLILISFCTCYHSFVLDDLTKRTRWNTCFRTVSITGNIFMQNLIPCYDKHLHNGRNYVEK